MGERRGGGGGGGGGVESGRGRRRDREWEGGRRGKGEKEWLAVISCGPFLSQINSKSSYALCHLVPKARRVSALSPLQLLKAVKNDTEAQGMRNSHVGDAHVYTHPHTLILSHSHTLTHITRSEMQLHCVNTSTGWKRR